MRTPAQGQPGRARPKFAKTVAFPAPVRGWIANENLATPKQGGADTLTNFFPTATGCRMRGGSSLHGTIGAGSPVTAFMTYSNAGTEKLFAATGTDIYDITSPSDPETSPTAAVTTQTGGDWVAVQFVNSGGAWLRAVNGQNTPQLYNGSSWTTSPAITGVTAANLSYVWAFKNRLFFIEKNTLNAWYLPVDNIGGAATVLPLQGVFQRGGSLLFGASWSLEDNSGLTANCAFVTTEGEVAVYQGTDPGSASTWSLVGVYRVGRPLGRKAWIRAGGDIVIATDVGFVPLSQAVARDYAALAPVAVSYAIEREWNSAVTRRTSPWHCEVWPTQQMAVIATPAVVGDTSAKMFVANVRTGSWALYTGWDATCVAVLGERLFYGTPTGKVIEAETGGYDQGAAYTATYVPLYSDIKTPSALKVVGMARAIYRAPDEMGTKVTAQFNYVTRAPAAPDALPNTASGSDLWGTGEWGTATWGGQRTIREYTPRYSVAGSGYAISTCLQMTSGQPGLPDVEIIGTELSFDMAEVFT
jgi:hypothetical protein